MIEWPQCLRGHRRRQVRLDLLGQLGFEELDAVADRLVLLHHIFYRAAGMDDRAVIAPTEVFTDFLERMLGQDSTQVHRNLAREGDIGGAPLAHHVRCSQLVVVGDTLLDPVDRYQVLGFLHQNVAEQFLNGLEVELLAGQ